MVHTYDPQGAPLILINLFVWGFVCWALLGPLSIWPISEILFYVAQERLILGLFDFRALAEAPGKKDKMILRLIYWAIILIWYLSRYLIINKPHDPNNYLENRPDLWKEYNYWPPMRPP